MSRQRRMFVQGKTCFILLEGHNGNQCFYDDACYRFYLSRIGNCLAHYQVEMHAYVLLPNEIQLLLTPGTAAGISQLMKTVGGAYVQYFNHRFERSGSLWKGRFKSRQLPDAGESLDVQKFMELAPAREGLVNHPGEYPWSSYCINAFGGHGKLLTPHPAYLALSSPWANRFRDYRSLLGRDFSAQELRRLEASLRTVPHPAAYPDNSGIRRIAKCRYTALQGNYPRQPIGEDLPSEKEPFLPAHL